MCSQSVNLLRFCIILDPNASVRQQRDLLKTALFLFGRKNRTKSVPVEGSKNIATTKKNKIKRNQRRPKVLTVRLLCRKSVSSLSQGKRGDVRKREKKTHIRVCPKNTTNIQPQS